MLYVVPVLVKYSRRQVYVDSSIVIRLKITFVHIRPPYKCPHSICLRRHRESRASDYGLKRFAGASLAEWYHIIPVILRQVHLTNRLPLSIDLHKGIFTDLNNFLTISLIYIWQIIFLTVALCKASLWKEYSYIRLLRSVQEVLPHLKQHRCRHLLRHRRKASYNRLFICLSEQLIQSPCQFTRSLHQLGKRTFILTISKVKLNLSCKCLYRPVISQLVKCIYRPVILQSVSAAVKLRRMDPLPNSDPSLLISEHILLYIRTARQKFHDHPSLSA